MHALTPVTPRVAIQLVIGTELASYVVEEIAKALSGG